MIAYRGGRSCKMVLWAAVLVIMQIAHTTGKGQFFVGLLGYHNPSEELCCDVELINGTCKEYCDIHLIFEVDVRGLQGNDNITLKRPADRPLSLREAEDFQALGVTNPLSFTFLRWPGEVNITVTAYNESNPDEAVDRFHLTFIRQGPMNYYIKEWLNSSESSEDVSSSQLQIVVRYICDSTLRPSCFTDCIEHPVNETCPTSLPSVTEVTFTGFTEPTKPFKIPTTPTSTTTTTTSTPAPTSMRTPTPIKYLDSGSPTPMKTRVPTKSKTSTAAPTKKVLTAQSPNDLSTRVHSAGPEGTTIRGTTGNTPVQYIADDEMTYWPAIVGGILGGVALMAAIGFLLYYRRQKKLRKRQEIYNVNPKILRNFEEYAMNGTSGRADVPLETEQY